MIVEHKHGQQMKMNSYEYRLLMNAQIKVLKLEFQIKRDEKVIHALLVVSMDRLEDIL